MNKPEPIVILNSAGRRPRMNADRSSSRTSVARRDLYQQTQQISPH